MVLVPLVGKLRKRTLLLVLVGVGAFFGALPDLLGAFGVFILKDRWVLYNSAHGGAISEVLRYVPMYGLHLLIDNLTHEKGFRWWVFDEGFWIEVSFWVVNALLIAWCVQQLTLRRQEAANAPAMRPSPPRP